MSTLRLFRPIVPIALAALLAGCAALAPPRTSGDPVPAAAATARPETPPTVLPPPPAAPPPPETQRAMTTPPTARPPVSPVPPAMPNDPVILVGLSQEQANAMLGPPSSIRQETPATVWAYRIGDCQLDLFFYEDVKTRRQQSLAYELQTREKTDQAQRACFNRIWTVKNGRP